MQNEIDPAKPTLREAAHSLWEAYFTNCPGLHPYVQSIGIGSDSIKVMLVRKLMGHERPFPREWQGWPVETRVVGRLVIGGQDPY